ncbi:hypothetical protein B0H16DRAFT_1453296 [Mycena metata]|uniref:Uncharacterized protein n=1 Tax=Mycena metata TaxID=1033252 RepID=A0AAD7NN44_9AGAR|nr:hypothetical protein B0H16DRAFT_1453296 [Mycena metata]
MAGGATSSRRTTTFNTLKNKCRGTFINATHVRKGGCSGKVEDTDRVKKLVGGIRFREWNPRTPERPQIYGLAHRDVFLAHEGYSIHRREIHKSIEILREDVSWVEIQSFFTWNHFNCTMIWLLQFNRGPHVRSAVYICRAQPIRTVSPRSKRRKLTPALDQEKNRGIKARRGPFLETSRRSGFNGEVEPSVRREFKSSSCSFYCRVLVANWNWVMGLYETGGTGEQLNELRPKDF